MTKQERHQVEQSLAQLRNFDLPDREKLELLDVIRKKVFPPDTFGDRGTKRNLDPNKMIDSTLFLLPLFESDAPVDERASAEIGRQVEMEVRASLNEKFVRSPAFLLLITIVSIGVTVFSFGLFTLNSDVKRADEIVNGFEKRLTDANTSISEAEAGEQAARYMNLILQMGAMEVEYALTLQRMDCA